jgi:hypothetical protein
MQRALTNVCTDGYRQAAKWRFHRRSRELLAPDSERALQMRVHTADGES